MGNPGIICDRMPDCHQFPGIGCMDDLTTECSFDSQAAWVIDVPGLFLDMLFVDVCTSDRLVQIYLYCISSLSI